MVKALVNSIVRFTCLFKGIAIVSPDCNQHIIALVFLKVNVVYLSCVFIWIPNPNRVFKHTVLAVNFNLRRRGFAVCTCRGNGYGKLNTVDYSADGNALVNRDELVVDNIVCHPCDPSLNNIKIFPVVQVAYDNRVVALLIVNIAKANLIDNGVGVGAEVLRIIRNIAVCSGDSPYPILKLGFFLSYVLGKLRAFGQFFGLARAIVERNAVLFNFSVLGGRYRNHTYRQHADNHSRGEHDT